MQGLNQLGKGPSRPRPHQRRRPNNNNRQRQEVLTDGIKADADYYKMVQEIEEQQQGQGWLFSRGAADKGDLLYLRDQEEKLRFVESERREKENELFTMQRKMLENKALNNGGILGKRSRTTDDKLRSQQALHSLLSALRPDAGSKSAVHGTPATSATTSPTVAPPTPGVGSSAAQTPTGSPTLLTTARPQLPSQVSRGSTLSTPTLETGPNSGDEHVGDGGKLSLPLQLLTARLSAGMYSSTVSKQGGQSSTVSSHTHLAAVVLSPEVTVTGGEATGQGESNCPEASEACAGSTYGDEGGDETGAGAASGAGRGHRITEQTGGLLAGFAAYQSDPDSEDDDN